MCKHGHISGITSAVKTSEGSFLADLAKLQQPDGSFSGDEWGEIDTRWFTAMPQFANVKT